MHRLVWLLSLASSPPWFLCEPAGTRMCLLPHPVAERNRSRMSAVIDDVTQLRLVGGAMQPILGMGVRV
jgi:hypothetical protein